MVLDAGLPISSGKDINVMLDHNPRAPPLRKFPQQITSIGDCLEGRNASNAVQIPATRSSLPTLRSRVKPGLMQL